MSAKSVVGVDVASRTFDTFTIGASRPKSYTNSKQGITGFIKSLQVLSAPFVVMEATGSYQRDLVRRLAAAGISYSVVNPRTIRHFAKAGNFLAKTDQIDARVIALYGERMAPRVTVPPTEAAIRLKAFVARRRVLVDFIADEKKRINTIEPFLRDDIETTIAFVQQQVAALNRQIKQLIQSCKGWAAQAALLNTVPGVGDVLIATLLAALPELGLLPHKQIAALVGVAPYNDDSGQHSGERRCWGGRADVRAALYMATIAAIRCNPVIKAYYAQLKDRGKKSKVAIVACMHKLLRILNAMVRDGKEWDHSND
jgi:transposase